MKRFFEEPEMSGSGAYRLDPGNWTPPEAGIRCVTLSGATSVAVGHSCWVRVTFCSTTAGKITNTLYARDALDNIGHAGEVAYSVNVVDNPQKQTCPA